MTHSIDEAFLDLAGFLIDDLTEFGRPIKESVLQRTSIPVTVGIAPTKCLTKFANEIVKQDPQYQGVLDLSALSDQEDDLGEGYCTRWYNKAISSRKTDSQVVITWAI